MFDEQRADRAGHVKVRSEVRDHVIPICVEPAKQGSKIILRKVLTNMISNVKHFWKSRQNDFAAAVVASAYTSGSHSQVNSRDLRVDYELRLSNEGDRLVRPFSLSETWLRYC